MRSSLVCSTFQNIAAHNIDISSSTFLAANRVPISRVYVINYVLSCDGVTVDE
jgi:hypothetical protein